MRLDWFEWLRIGALALAAIAAWVVLTRDVRAQTCIASFYDRGRVTANGERFNNMGQTVAYPDRRMIGHRLRITNLANHRSGIFRVNDVGPAYWTHHCVDLTRGGARQLGFETNGVARVSIERLR